ncbi:hypothetical protein [Nocardiopsis flavescens]
MPESTYHQIHFAWADPTLLGRTGPGPASASFGEDERLTLRAWRNRLQPALTVDYRVCLPDPADHPETLWVRSYDDGQAALVYRWPGELETAHAWAIVGPADGLTLPRVLSLHENPNTRPHRTRPPRAGWGAMPALDAPEPWERSAAPGAVRARDRRAADLTAPGGEELLALGVAAALERPDLPVRVFLAPDRADLWNAVQLRFLWGMHRSLYEVLSPRGTTPAPGWDWSLSTYDPVLGESGQHIVFGPPAQTPGPLLRMPGTEFRTVAERLVGVLRDEGGDALVAHLAERGVPDAPTFGERRDLLADWLDPSPAGPRARSVPGAGAEDAWPPADGGGDGVAEAGPGADAGTDPGTAEAVPERSPGPEPESDGPRWPGGSGPRARTGTAEGASRTRPFLTGGGSLPAGEHGGGEGVPAGAGESAAAEASAAGPESADATGGPAGGGLEGAADPEPVAGGADASGGSAGGVDATARPADPEASPDPLRPEEVAHPVDAQNAQDTGDDLPEAEPLPGIGAGGPVGRFRPGGAGAGAHAEGGAPSFGMVVPGEPTGTEDDDLPEAEPLPGAGFRSGGGDAEETSEGGSSPAGRTVPGGPGGAVGDDRPGAEPLPRGGSRADGRTDGFRSDAAGGDALAEAGPPSPGRPVPGGAGGDDRPGAEPLPADVSGTGGRTGSLHRGAGAGTGGLSEGEPPSGRATGPVNPTGHPRPTGAEDDDLPEAEPLPGDEADGARRSGPAGLGDARNTGLPEAEPPSAVATHPAHPAGAAHDGRPEDQPEARSLPGGIGDPERSTDPAGHTRSADSGGGASASGRTDVLSPGGTRPAEDDLPDAEPLPGTGDGTGHHPGSTGRPRPGSTEDPTGSSQPTSSGGTGLPLPPGHHPGSGSGVRPSATAEDGPPEPPPFRGGSTDPAHRADRPRPAGIPLPPAPAPPPPGTEGTTGPVRPPFPVEADDSGDDLPEAEALPGDTGGSSAPPPSPFRSATRARDLSDDLPARAWASREAAAEAAAALPEIDPPGTDETGPQAPPGPAVPIGRTSVEPADTDSAPAPADTGEPLWPRSPSAPTPAPTPASADPDEALWPSAASAVGPGPAPEGDDASDPHRPRLAPPRAETDPGPGPDSPLPASPRPRDDRPPRIFDAPEPHESRRPRIAPATADPEPPEEAVSADTPRRSPSPIRTGLFRKRGGRRDTPAAGTAAAGAPREPEPEASRADGRVRALAEGAFGGRPTRSTPEPPGPDEYQSAPERTPDEAPPLFPHPEPAEPGAGDRPSADAFGDGTRTEAIPAPDYATETVPERADHVAPGDNWPTQYADLPLARLERWLTKYGPEEARVDLVDARAAVRAERSELQRVRDERDHYHGELQDSRREVARLDRSWLDREDDDEPLSVEAPRRRWPSRVLVVLLLFAFLVTGLEAGARFGTGALDLLGTLTDAPWWPL